MLKFTEKGNVEGSTHAVPNMACNKKDKEEIIVEVTIEANEVKKLDYAWRIFLDACLLNYC